MIRRSFSLLGPLSLILLLLGLDQLTKSYIVQNFTVQGMPQKVLPILDLVLVWNRGVSWGLFNNMGAYNTVIFGSFAGIMSIVLSVWLWRAVRPCLAYGLALIISGALGNLIDRLKYGGVVDFLSFHWKNSTFPAFNVADAAITVGAGLILLDEYLTSKRSKAHVL